MRPRAARKWNGSEPKVKPHIAIRRKENKLGMRTKKKGRRGKERSRLLMKLNIVRQEEKSKSARRRGVKKGRDEDKSLHIKEERVVWGEKLLSNEGDGGSPTMNRSMMGWRDRNDQSTRKERGGLFLESSGKAGGPGGSGKESWEEGWREEGRCGLGSEDQGERERIGGLMRD